MADAGITVSGGKRMKNTIDRWNEAALQYTGDQEQSAFAECNRQIVKERFRDLHGLKVLDLGCGYGYYTDYFRRIGADVLGIDGSDAMLGIARSRYPECRFAQCDITEELPFPDASFDLIFCNQVLMDVGNIETVFAECSRLMKPQGTLYCSIVHPAFYIGGWLEDSSGFRHAKAVGIYITPCLFMNRFWGETEHYHRPLSHYLNAAAAAGLCLIRAEEPVTYDGVTKNDDIPLFFFAEYRKA